MYSYVYVTCFLEKCTCKCIDLKKFLFLLMSLILQNKSSCPHAVTQEELLLLRRSLSSIKKYYLSSALA